VADVLTVERVRCSPLAAFDVGQLAKLASSSGMYSPALTAALSRETAPGATDVVSDHVAITASIKTKAKANEHLVCWIQEAAPDHEAPTTAEVVGAAGPHESVLHLTHRCQTTPEHGLEHLFRRLGVGWVLLSLPSDQATMVGHPASGVKRAASLQDILGGHHGRRRPRRGFIGLPSPHYVADMAGNDTHRQVQMDLSISATSDEQAQAAVQRCVGPGNMVCYSIPADMSIVLEGKALIGGPLGGCDQGVGPTARLGVFPFVYGGGPGAGPADVEAWLQTEGNMERTFDRKGDPQADSGWHTMRVEMRPCVVGEVYFALVLSVSGAHDGHDTSGQGSGSSGSVVWCGQCVKLHVTRTDDSKTRVNAA